MKWTNLLSISIFSDGKSQLGTGNSRLDKHSRKAQDKGPGKKRFSQQNCDFQIYFTFFSTHLNLLLYVNNIRVCDEQLFGQVRTHTGRYQLPILHCTNVHPRRGTSPLFGRAVLRWRHESQWANNILPPRAASHCGVFI